MRRLFPGCIAALLLAVLPASAQSPTLEFSTPVTGTLSPDHPQAIYAFEGKAGTVITLTQRAAAFDSLLTLTFPDELGELTDDDSADRRNARIGPLQLPVSGTYQVTAGSAVPPSANSTFTLTLQQPEVETLDPSRRRGTRMAADTEMMVYRLPVEQGAVYSITVAGTDLDPVLTLSHTSTPTEPPLRDDDSARRTYALLAPYIVPEPGDVLFGVSPYDLGSEGRFNLSVRRYSPLRLTENQPITLSLFDRMPFLLAAFDGAAGEHVTLRVDGDAERDTILHLIDPSGTVIALVDDDSDLHPTLEAFELPLEGRYQVVVSPIMAGLDVTVTLTISKA